MSTCFEKRLNMCIYFWERERECVYLCLCQKYASANLIETGYVCMYVCTNLCMWMIFLCLRKEKYVFAFPYIFRVYMLINMVMSLVKKNTACVVGRGYVCACMFLFSEWMYVCMYLWILYSYLSERKKQVRECVSASLYVCVCVCVCTHWWWEYVFIIVYVPVQPIRMCTHECNISMCTYVFSLFTEVRSSSTIFVWGCFCFLLFSFVCLFVLFFVDWCKMIRNSNIQIYGNANYSFCCRR